MTNHGTASSRDRRGSTAHRGVELDSGYVWSVVTDEGSTCEEAAASGEATGVPAAERTFQQQSSPHGSVGLNGGMPRGALRTFAAGEEPGVTGDGGPVELQLDMAVEIDAEGVCLAVTHWVPRSFRQERVRNTGVSGFVAKPVYQQRFCNKPPLCCKTLPGYGSSSARQYNALHLSGGQNMAGFFREWGRLLVAPLSRIGGATSMIRPLFAMASAIPPTIAAVLCATTPLPWWAFCIVFFVVWWASLTAGMAWELRGPEVEVEPLKLDLGPNKIFYMRLRAASRKVKPIVKIVNVIYSPDAKPLERSYEAHWRGWRPENGILELPGEEAEFGLVGVQKLPSGNPILFVWPQEGGAVPLSGDVPPEQQAVVTVRVVVGCSTPVGKEEWRAGREQTFTYCIVPDPGSAVGYKVESRAVPAREHDLRWAFDRFCTLVERVFGSRHNPQS